MPSLETVLLNVFVERYRLFPTKAFYSEFISHESLVLKIFTNIFLDAKSPHICYIMRTQLKNSKNKCLDKRE